MKTIRNILCCLMLLALFSCANNMGHVPVETMDQAQSEYKSGFEYLQEGNLNEAFPLLLHVAKVLEILPEDMSEEEQLLASRAYYQMAYVFRCKIESNAEIDALRRALAYQRNVQDTTWIIRSSLDLADAFSSLKEIDSARYYLDIVMPCLDTVSGDLNDYFIARHVLSDLYYSQHQFDSFFMVEHNTIAFKMQRGMSAANDSVGLGICMYHSPYRLEAKPYLLKILEIETGEVERGAVMSLLEQIYEEEGNADSVAFCHGFNKTYVQAESDRVSDGMLAVKQYEQYKAERDARLSALRKQKSTRRGVVVAITIVLLVAVAFVLYHQSHKKRLREVNDTLKSKELEALNIQAMAIYNDKRNNTLKRLLELFHSTYPDALSKLKTTYPDLNDTELDICVLSFFPFRTKEISDILDLRENTVSKYRTAIKKKTQADSFEALWRQFLG